MPQTEAWTIGRLLQWTTNYLREHKIESPRLEAEILLAEARGCQRIELYTAFEQEPSEEVKAAFRELVRRRAEGTPVAYLVGRREFYSLSFRVTPDVLIPRPETEFLVIAALDLAKTRPADSPPPVVADVGTGSGIVAICLAKNLAGSHVTAIDISPAALEVARQNAGVHGVAEQITFVESDLFSRLPIDADTNSKKFDFVVSNPPYVKSGEMAQIPREVRDYEPYQALDAGPNGTDVIERLIPQAAEHLNAGGYLLMEISPQIEPGVRELISANGSFELLPTLKDLAGHPRIVQARRR